MFFFFAFHFLDELKKTTYVRKRNYCMYATCVSYFQKRRKEEKVPLQPRTLSKEWKKINNTQKNKLQKQYLQQKTIYNQQMLVYKQSLKFKLHKEQKKVHELLLQELQEKLQEEEGKVNEQTKKTSEEET